MSKTRKLTDEEILRIFSNKIAKDLTDADTSITAGIIGQDKAREQANITPEVLEALEAYKTRTAQKKPSILKPFINFWSYDEAKKQAKLAEIKQKQKERKMTRGTHK
jgi:hypothetical protein